jgi:RNA polymerase-binding protein DksA
MGTKTKRKESNLEHRQSVLLAEREELIGRLHARRSEIVAERESDDEAGIALQTVIRDFTYVSLENEIRTLAEVELSLRRLETGEYGLCGSCGEEIAAARLDALPWTRVCVACAGGRVGSEPQVWQARRTQRRRGRPIVIRFEDVRQIIQK